MKLWTNIRPFVIDDIVGEVRTVSTTKSLESTLFINGQLVAKDVFAFPRNAKNAIYRNNHIAHVLSDGRTISIESGYVGWWKTQIAVRINGVLRFESAPGAKISWPSVFRTKETDQRTPAQIASDDAEAKRQQEQFQRNKPSLFVDLAIGVLFYVVAKYSNLTTAALVSAGAGIAVWIAQRFVKMDLLGGLATFGIIMSLITAGFAWTFQDDDMVKMRSTILGILTALLFLGDGLFGGRYLGKRLARFMPYPDIVPSRLAVGLGMMGLVMAALNFIVAKTFSTDTWLFYTTFLDTALAFAMVFAVIEYARGKGEINSA
jgi:intracellular septation protein A